MIRTIEDLHAANRIFYADYAVHRDDGHLNPEVGGHAQGHLAVENQRSFSGRVEFVGRVLRNAGIRRLLRDLRSNASRIRSNGHQPVGGPMKAFYCRPCYLHDRQTIVHADDFPTEPCSYHFASASLPRSKACKRIEWVERNHFCSGCAWTGRTEIAYGDDPNGNGVVCRHGHTRLWAETAESRWALEGAGTRA